MSPFARLLDLTFAGKFSQLRFLRKEEQPLTHREPRAARQDHNNVVPHSQPGEHDPAPYLQQGELPLPPLLAACRRLCHSAIAMKMLSSSGGQGEGGGTGMRGHRYIDRPAVAWAGMPC